MVRTRQGTFTNSPHGEYVPKLGNAVDVLVAVDDPPTTVVIVVENTLVPPGPVLVVSTTVVVGTGVRKDGSAVVVEVDGPPSSKDVVVIGRIENV